MPETRNGTLRDAATFSQQIPTALLLRHGARLLDPTNTVVAPGEDLPRPTAYRADALLVPAEAGSDKVLTEINELLRRVNLRLERPADLQRSYGPARLSFGADSRLPTSINAWAALQTLRAAAKGHPLEPVINRIGLDHLLFGSSLHGSPGPYEGSPETGFISYYRTRRGGPLPVRVVAPPPPRCQDCVAPGNRRPVIAVLDTGIGQHPWLDHLEQKPGNPIPDTFLTSLPDLQAEILNLQTAGNPPYLLDVVDAPDSSRPLLGDVDTHVGHGTFISGIVRQLAPDAQVLAIRVMFTDGVAYENAVVTALTHLVDRMQTAIATNDPSLLVDVVSLSFGYFNELDVAGAVNSEMSHRINQLIDLGVLVVAAAGNHPTDRPFIPAALPGPPPGDRPVVSVGALNPNGTKAVFSGDGSWVRYWRDGAAMVSCFPTDIEGGEQPGIAVDSVDGLPEPLLRSDLDQDNYHSGFAVWHGTSFAVPVAAAGLANNLISNSVMDPASHGLADVNLGAARAAAAAVTLNAVSSYDYQSHAHP